MLQPLMAIPQAITVFFLLFCLISSTISVLYAKPLTCNGTEKHALLSFRRSLYDPADSLSSWSAHESCCAWEGVHCDNITGRITKLDLSNLNLELPLGGQVSNALLQIEFLNYLDLSGNNFEGIPIPSFIGSMHTLTYLDLSEASFSGLIPPQLGNLSNLHYLGLGSGLPYYEQLYVENLSWMSHLSSLENLDLYEVDLHREVHWLEHMSMLSSLSNLQLNSCELESMSPSLGYINFTSLTILSLVGNNFDHEIPNWLFNLTSHLVELDVSGNALKGHIPNSILELHYLNALYLSNNKFTGHIPEYLGQLIHLETLSLDDNYFDGPIPSSVGNLSSLTFLTLNGNRLNGTLPSSMWDLSDLIHLDIGENSLAGTISEVHLNKLSKLKYLAMYSTSVTFKVKYDWVPPFQLEFLEMSSCHMGPRFPTWLQTQTSLKSLSLEESGIVDMVPKWFWRWASHLYEMDLSDNRLMGDLSGVQLNNVFIDLSSNCFMGELPRLSPLVQTLKMDNNSFSGPVSPFLCQTFNGRSNLQQLDISSNRLYAELSNCRMPWEHLTHLNMGNNHLSGIIPDSWGSLFQLEALHLNHNGFYGDIPPFLRNYTSLRLLDLSGNSFSGNIPSWIGEMTSLMVLSLRSNRLVGNIPPHICQLSSLTILDSSNNSLSGTIPKCFNNLSLMTTIRTDAFDALESSFWGEYYENLLLVMKGKESQYKSILKLVRTIDLSSNALQGTIPSVITNLCGLQCLNLSSNQLTGSIPEKLGNMKAVESLDLSRNHLSGEIPESMRSLTFLNHLDLSYNNFSGKIPSSTQLQSFNETSYIGNPELCGAPLTKNCKEDDEEEDDDDDAADDDEDDEKMRRFYIGMGVGFAVGFWGVSGALLFKKSWRFAYFRFLSHAYDWIYVFIAIRWNQLRNKLRGDARS